MTFDMRKLKGKIVEKYGTQDKIAVDLGLSPTTLSFKLNGKSEFSQGETAKIAELLNLAPEDFSAYFFTPAVQKTEPAAT